MDLATLFKTPIFSTTGGEAYIASLEQVQLKLLKKVQSWVKSGKPIWSYYFRRHLQSFIESETLAEFRLQLATSDNFDEIRRFCANTVQGLVSQTRLTNKDIFLSILVAVDLLRLGEMDAIHKILAAHEHCFGNLAKIVGKTFQMNYLEPNHLNFFNRHETDLKGLFLSVKKIYTYRHPDDYSDSESDSGDEDIDDIKKTTKIINKAQHYLNSIRGKFSFERLVACHIGIGKYEDALFRDAAQQARTVMENAILDTFSWLRDCPEKQSRAPNADYFFEFEDNVFLIGRIEYAPKQVKSELSNNSPTVENMLKTESLKFVQQHGGNTSDKKKFRVESTAQWKHDRWFIYIQIVFLETTKQDRLKSAKDLFSSLPFSTVPTLEDKFKPLPFSWWFSNNDVITENVVANASLLQVTVEENRRGRIEKHVEAVISELEKHLSRRVTVDGKALERYLNQTTLPETNQRDLNVLVGRDTRCIANVEAFSAISELCRIGLLFNNGDDGRDKLAAEYRFNVIECVRTMRTKNMEALSAPAPGSLPPFLPLLFEALELSGTVVHKAVLFVKVVNEAMTAIGKQRHMRGGKQLTAGIFNTNNVNFINQLREYLEKQASKFDTLWGRLMCALRSRVGFYDTGFHSKDYFIAVCKNVVGQVKYFSTGWRSGKVGALVALASAVVHNTEGVELPIAQQSVEWLRVLQNLDNIDLNYFESELNNKSKPMSAPMARLHQWLEKTEEYASECGDFHKSAAVATKLSLDGDTPQEYFDFTQCGSQPEKRMTVY